jgi:hypothetical protein
VDATIIIYYDNINNILLVNNSINCQTKYIKVHYHFLRKMVVTKEIDLVHVCNKNQVVNFFTKVLNVYKL